MKCNVTPELIFFFFVFARVAHWAGVRLRIVKAQHPAPSISLFSPALADFLYRVLKKADSLSHSYPNACNLVIVHRHKVKVKRAQPPSEPGSDRPRDVGQADGVVRLEGLGRLCIINYI